MKISQERDKLQSIQTRLAKCDAKVRHIGENPNQVCTIYSAATFPASHTAISQKKLFSLTTPNPAPISHINYRLSANHRMQIAERINNNELYSDLVRATTTRVENNTKKETQEHDSLGRFPPRVDSVSAALLFNSEENPYKNYDSFNNLESVADYRKKVKVEKQLAAAPTTIAQGVELPMFTGLQFDYRPDLGVVPTFAMPDQLNLKNIANISFGSAQTTSIAPSSTAVLDLPSFGLVQSTFQQSRQTASNASVAMPPAVAAAAPPAAAPPPPSAPPALAAQPAQPSVTAASHPAAVASPSAPAITPATTTAAAAPQGLTAVPPKPSTKSLLPPENAGRGSLLDSIRQGLKLKKVDDNDHASASASSSASQSNDIQSLIFAGIKRHAALMNGHDPDEKIAQAKQKKAATPGDNLASKFESIQKRLDDYHNADDDDDDTEDPDDW